MKRVKSAISLYQTLCLLIVYLCTMIIWPQHVSANESCGWDIESGILGNSLLQPAGKQADGYIIMFTNVKIVSVVTDTGMTGREVLDLL